MSDVGTQSNGTPGRVYTSYEEYVKDLYERRKAAREKAFAETGRSPTEFESVEFKVDLGPLSGGVKGDDKGWHWDGDGKYGSKVNDEGKAKKWGWGIKAGVTVKNKDWKFENSKVKEVSGSAGYGYGKYNLNDGTITGGAQWPPGFGGGVKLN